MKLITSAVVAALTVAAALPAAADGHKAAVKTATAVIIDGSGTEIGSAQLTQGPAGVLMYIKVSGLTPGAHGLHLHETGICETGENFTTSKSHVGHDHGDGIHGLLNPEGPESGDIPNLYVASDGIGEMEAHLTMVSLGGDKDDLLDGDGTAFVIHENADDHMTQPIGGAGARIACGVITAGS